MQACPTKYVQDVSIGTQAGLAGFEGFADSVCFVRLAVRIKRSGLTSLLIPSVSVMLSNQPDLVLDLSLDLVLNLHSFGVRTHSLQAELEG